MVRSDTSSPRGPVETIVVPIYLVLQPIVLASILGRSQLARFTDSKVTPKSSRYLIYMYRYRYLNREILQVLF